MLGFVLFGFMMLGELCCSMDFSSTITTFSLFRSLFSSDCCDEVVFISLIVDWFYELPKLGA